MKHYKSVIFLSN